MLSIGFCVAYTLSNREDHGVWVEDGKKHVWTGWYTSLTRKCVNVRVRSLLTAGEDAKWSAPLLSSGDSVNSSRLQGSCGGEGMGRSCE